MRASEHPGKKPLEFLLPGSVMILETDLFPCSIDLHHIEQLRILSIRLWYTAYDQLKQRSCFMSST